MALVRQGITTREDIGVPSPPERDTTWWRWMRDFVNSLRQSFRVHQHLFPATISGELKVNGYTIATKPTASVAGAKAIVFVSDEAVGQQFQGSDGTNWRFLG